MRQFAVILLLVSGYALKAGAQSFLDEVKSKKTGEGTITVTQSKDIDELVNNTKLVKSAPSPAVQTPNDNKGPAAGNTEHHQERTIRDTADHTVKDQRHDNTGSMAYDTPSVSTGKKVMRNSRKITGYRIQVFSGGNSREDRQKAESIGSTIKMKYPGLPVYVHFYSPRWICRAGNFRTYQEAENVLKELKSMGYKQACIVKGKITVAY